MNCKPSSTGCNTGNNCPRCDGCIDGVCPDFQIKRNDTRPAFKVSVEDENGPMDLTGLVIEANMWATGKLKANITDLDTTLALADNIGFCQILTNDIILMDRARGPEQMRITGFDEDNSLVLVERGYNGTVPQAWKKGTVMRIFRLMNAPALSELLYEDVTQVDGTVDCNVLTDSNLIYEWNVNDTCISGCFSFEFKVLKLVDGPIIAPSVIPDCFLGVGVEWTRRFPPCGEFLIKVCDSPTSEVSIPLSTT
jgi:hypothetical protein